MTARPGAYWRVLSHVPRGQSHYAGPAYVDADFAAEGCAAHHVPGEFDELVVGEPAWLHVEQMSDRAWWMDVAGVVVNVTFRKDGTVKCVVVDLDPRDGVKYVGPWTS